MLQGTIDLNWSRFLAKATEFQLITPIVMIFTYIFRRCRGAFLAGGLLFAHLDLAQAQINVTNYGAVGDAVQFYVNTVSNRVVVTSTARVPSTAIGDAIEIFGAGTPTFGMNSYGVVTNGNQDLIATITNVLNGTNIYVSTPPWSSLTNAFATYGHNNTTNFQNAIDSATGTNTIIHIPAGKYLLLTATNIGQHASGTFYSSLVLTSGGITLNGEGTNTILIGQGAWTIPNNINPDGSVNTSVVRGWLFAIKTPVANDFGFTLANIVLDGGVPNGLLDVQGYPPNTVDGLGWDGLHDAIDVYGASENTFTYQLFTNVTFQHWRGEMLKSTDYSTNGNLTLVNCRFHDGNATAINYYAAIAATNCYFDNLFQIAEYYQAYSTNTTVFFGCIFTNLAGNGFAVNGGRGGNPSLVIESNTFYSTGGNSVETTPGDNVYVLGNSFIAQNLIRNATAVALGVNGYQGTFDNSNIVIAANSFSGFNTALTLGGGSGPTDPERVESVIFTNNTGSPDIQVIMGVYGWTTNVTVADNVFGGDSANGFPDIAFGAGSSPYILIPTNNIYNSGLRDPAGITNIISYSSGSRYEIWYSMAPNAIWALDASDSNRIPSGAQIIITNGNWSGLNLKVYLNDAMTAGPVYITNQQAQLFSWTNGNWSAVSSGPQNPIPLPAIQVSPGNFNFGTNLNGTSTTNSFIVQNIGGGILTGAATATAPFSIVSGATYNLGSNQSQTVTVVFDPTAAGHYNGTVTFSGEGGTNALIAGAATNAPVPILSVTPGNINFGTILSGTRFTNNFTVKNIGNGILNGSVAATAPFTIVSGGSYSLGSNQSQTVSIVFSPTAASNYSQAITFLGGNGTNATISGTATNAPVPLLSVTPGSISFGTILSGMRITNSFTVNNSGNGILSGSATATAPFSIVSGGTYILGSNQSQAVTVVFNPTVASNYSQTVTFSGGRGTNATVSGTGTNAPAVSPTLSAISANVSNLGTNATVLEIAAGTVQLSATATAANNDPLTWQWSHTVNGGAQVVNQLGSGNTPTNTFTYSPNVGGDTYLWTLQVTNTANGLSTQSQITIFVQVPVVNGLKAVPQ